MTEGYPTATVEGREVPYDPSTLRRIQEHPCFSEKACHAFGRMHLAVAPKCNIQCNYCQRDYDCVNESRPGVTSRVLRPEEVVDMVKGVLDKHEFIKVIGIAGPGDPLANEETFEALRLVKEHFPETMLCISTNGLMLPERVDELAELGVGNLTVTMNALDPEVGAKIYDHINYHGKRYTGVEAAKILIANQLKGVEEAVKHGMIVKINTVWVPGVNDDQIIEIAETTSKLGAYTFNLIPVIRSTSSRTSCPRHRPRSARCRTGARRISSRCATASAAGPTPSGCSATTSRYRKAAPRAPDPGPGPGRPPSFQSRERRGELREVPLRTGHSPHGGREKRGQAVISRHRGPGTPQIGQRSGASSSATLPQTGQSSTFDASRSLPAFTASAAFA